MDQVPTIKYVAAFWIGSKALGNGWAEDGRHSPLFELTLQLPIRRERIDIKMTVNRQGIVRMERMEVGKRERRALYLIQMALNYIHHMTLICHCHLSMSSGCQETIGLFVPIVHRIRLGITGPIIIAMNRIKREISGCGSIWVEDYWTRDQKRKPSEIIRSGKKRSGSARLYKSRRRPEVIRSGA